jgi:hypothetical protein
LGDRATFLSLKNPVETRIQGNVFDAAENKITGVNQARVEIVGSSGSNGWTNERGAFTISGVTHFEPYPVHIEVTAKGRFKHRYQIKGPFTNAASGSAMDHKTLFMFSGQMIQEWITEYGSGVDPKSGIGIVGLPESVREAGLQSELRGEVQVLASGATFDPRPLALSEDGRVLGHSSMDRGQPRMVIFDLPEGLFATRVRDASGNVLWMRTDVASPGVVNMIGPE